MKLLLTLAVFLFWLPTLSAQSVSVSFGGGQGAISNNQIALKSGTATVQASGITVNETRVNSPVSWSVSPDGSKLGIMKTNGGISYTLLDHNGNRIAESALEFFNMGDESIAVYQFNDGRAVTRDNIANFTFFDAGGSVLYSVSNSSQSSGGEQISQLSADPSGKTIVLYNPVISYGARTGSRAQLVLGNNNVREFFRSDSRKIEHVHVTNDGLFISVLVAGGGEDRVYVYDRFGNELHQMGIDSERTGVTLSGNGEYLTAYGAGRVQVFNIATGESVGSSSSRTTILYGEYIPRDDIILAFGGDVSGSTISDASIVAVHVGQRQIARSDLSVSPSITKNDSFYLNRLSSGRYRLSGLNQDLVIRASF
ncbi:MAG: hypothetical protein R3283_00155 [Balneolaceae bacterium]|nr:hypothetical protein [Balneolaceae bacterium]